MPHTRAVARIASAGLVIALVAVIAGVLGLSLLFSDVRPGESLFGRAVLAAAVFAGAGFAIGALAGRAWWTAALPALPSVLVGLVVTALAVTGGLADWRAGVIWLLPLPLTLGAGFAGRRLMERHRRHG